VFKPSTNGAVERFHRTLNSMLGKVVSESQRDWDEKLPYVLAAYRAFVHDSTGYSPNRLFLGRESRMPVDLAIGLSTSDANPEDSIDDYVYRQQELAAGAYQQVREHLQTSAERQKQSYDTRVRSAPFELNQWVWYHYPRKYQGRSPKWQKSYIGPYLIVRCIPPVNYVLQRTRHSKPFVVHTDKIKRCYGNTPPSWLRMDSTTASESNQPDGTGNDQQGQRREDRDQQSAPPASSHGQASSWRSSGPVDTCMPRAAQHQTRAEDAVASRCQPRPQRTAHHADSRGAGFMESAPAMELGPRARRAPPYLTDYIC